MSKLKLIPDSVRYASTNCPVCHISYPGLDVLYQHMGSDHKHLQPPSPGLQNPAEQLQAILPEEVKNQIKIKKSKSKFSPIKGSIKSKEDEPSKSISDIISLEKKASEDSQIGDIQVRDQGTQLVQSQLHASMAQTVYSTDSTSNLTQTSHVSTQGSVDLSIHDHSSNVSYSMNKHYDGKIYESKQYDNRPPGKAVSSVSGPSFFMQHPAAIINYPVLSSDHPTWNQNMQEGPQINNRYNASQ